MSKYIRDRAIDVYICNGCTRVGTHKKEMETHCTLGRLSDNYPEKHHYSNLQWSVFCGRHCLEINEWSKYFR